MSGLGDTRSAFGGGGKLSGSSGDPARVVGDLAEISSQRGGGGATVAGKLEAVLLGPAAVRFVEGTGTWDRCRVVAGARARCAALRWLAL